MRRLIITLFGITFALSFALALGGCAQPSQLTLRAVKHDVQLRQNFSQAYAGRGDTGEELFVLVADDADRPAPSNSAERHEATGPLRASASATTLRQVVYVKVLWRTMNGVDRNCPTANAAIDWYVLSNSATGQNDLLQ